MIIKKRRPDTMTVLILLVVVGVVATELLQGVLLDNQPTDPSHTVIATTQR